MIERENIRQKSSAKGTRVVTALFSMVVAALAVVSFTNPASALENMATLKGEVIAVDTYAGTLSVRSSDPIESYATGSEGSFKFSLGENTNVTTCFLSRTFEDIKVGEMVAVTYHETDGRPFADAIDIAPIMLACYDQ